MFTYSQMAVVLINTQVPPEWPGGRWFKHLVPVFLIPSIAVRSIGESCQVSFRALSGLRFTPFGEHCNWLVTTPGECFCGLIVRRLSKSFDVYFMEELFGPTAPR